jgi:hypothetical protein
MRELSIKTHELWLVTLMAAFMSKDAEAKRVLTDFSDIIFRHFTWIEKALVDENIEYDYNRDEIPIKVDNTKVIYNNIIERINTLELMLVHANNEDLKFRIEKDLEYIKFVVSSLEGEEVSAFNAKREYKNYNLSKEATDAFTLFLFEESYKEYELIMIYNYLKAHSNDDYLNKIFQILVDESFFHLKSFGQMMAVMGILGVPRVIHKSLYQVEDVVTFLKDGIDEELAAKEQCLELSEAVGKDSEELSKFFDFINYQENYHIALMKDALKYYESKGN